MPHFPSTACRSLMLVACRAPPLSWVPRAYTHLPGVIASVFAGDCLLYVVLSSTVTVVWLVLPLGSVLVTLMVLPDTDATEPRTQAGLAGAGDGGSDGGVVVEPPGAFCGGFGQAPLTDSLIFTDAAVTGCPGAGGGPSAGFTLTQLPGVTSGNPAGTASVILVVEVKLTEAVPLSSLVT